MHFLRKECEKMKKALVFMANGFEEVEALTVVDFLRRAEVQVDICSIYDEKEVEGEHGVKLTADICLKDVKDPQEYDAVITPGGLPGATNLRDEERVVSIMKQAFDKPGRWVASICAAPFVLAAAGIAPQIAGTCYPGCEDAVGYKEYRKEPVVVDKNVVTGMGPALAPAFALKLVELLAGEEKAKEVGDGLLTQFVK